MKHLLPVITLILMLTASTQAMGQETYTIKSIQNAQSIAIGNRQKKVNDTFKGTDRIVFTNKKECLVLKKEGSSRDLYVNEEVMKARNAQTLDELFAKKGRRKGTNNRDKTYTPGAGRGYSGNAPEIAQGERNTSKYPEKRIALVIGNSNYQELDGLPNALNDARDVSYRLKQLGFDVITLYDGNINDMQTTVNSFFQVAQSYQVALIYFAGHGIRYEGKDYLLSVDRGDMGIKDECNLDYLIDESEKWKSNGKVMIFVIDACRNRKGFNDDDRVPSAKRGTAILQSTSSGEVALDADAGSGNSPFATAFINGVGQSGEDIEEEFSNIRRQVRKSTNDSQVPRTSLGGGYDFYFCKGCQPQTTKIQSTNQPAVTQRQQSTYTAEQLAQYTKKGKEEYDKKNYSEAVRLFKIAAEGGDAEAQAELGWCYLDGNGITKSYSEAFKWFSQSANQGNANGQNGLGGCYRNGYGVNQSYSESIKWFRLSAEQGYAKAQANLGYSYQKGYGVDQSWSIAAKWYRLAAEQGHSMAQNNLGACYKDGAGVPQSCTEALKWFRLSAEKGNSTAQCNLGDLYLNGKCVRQSYPESVKWFRLSAAQGYANAQFALGLCYENGLGVTKSYTEAVKWYRLAAKQGHKEATEKLAGL